MSTATDDISIGRITDERKDGLTYIRVDRATPLGNPFIVGKDGTREEVIEMYRAYLPGAYQRSGPVRDGIDAIVDKMIHGEYKIVLLCWCAPLPCHGSVIKEFVLDIIKAIEKSQYSLAMSGENSFERGE